MQHFRLRFTLNVLLFVFQKDTREGNTDLPKLDLNVIAVWSRNITGQGVVVSVLDDGKHICLKPLYIWGLMSFQLSSENPKCIMFQITSKNQYNIKSHLSISVLLSVYLRCYSQTLLQNKYLCQNDPLYYFLKKITKIR